MNTDQNFQSRFFAAVAAAAVSAMCVLGTIGPVQAGELIAPTQVAQTDTQQVAA
ncbi:MAG: hypothetical protein ACTS1Z_02515 [Parasphingopyxis sp.]|uniref:hypothetical protein n=1 Tax=Parasphingopyxis sp. TaxID=1920299 RepID=UPI003F9F3722